MNADGISLADAVEATDALLQQIGVHRQIKQHEVMCELEVTALAADLGTYQYLAAGFKISKKCRRPVAFDDA